MEGPLIANLRGQIVEFLKDGSLERLRIFSSPTCVSFSTDAHRCPSEGFLGAAAADFGNRIGLEVAARLAAGLLNRPPRRPQRARLIARSTLAMRHSSGANLRCAVQEY